MNPTNSERDELFQAFGRAFFRQDLDALYEIVTEDFVYSIMLAGEPRLMNRREQIEEFFKERLKIEKDLRFEDIVFHHAPEATFMTYLVKGTNVDSGEAFERIGVERYTFRDGRIAEKDVYSRPTQAVA